MDADLKKQLVALLLEKSFRYSPEPVFKLASGKMSTYYIDCRKSTHSCVGKHIIGNLILDLIKDTGVRAVGGLNDTRGRGSGWRAATGRTARQPHCGRNSC